MFLLNHPKGGHSPLLYCKGGGMGVGWWVKLLFADFEKFHHPGTGE